MRWNQLKASRGVGKYGHCEGATCGTHRRRLSIFEADQPRKYGCQPVGSIEVETRAGRVHRNQGDFAASGFTSRGFLYFGTAT